MFVLFLGGAAAYAGLNGQQCLAKQEQAHQTGKAPHVKTAEKLGLLDSQGRPAWHIVQHAGGPKAFVGASAEQTAALVAKGTQGKRAHMAAMNQIH